MPCYDPRDKESTIVYSDKRKPEDDELISRLTDSVGFLTGSLCAIITELEKKGLAYKIISQASKSGLIDIMKFWDRHRKEDEVRMAAVLHKFSEHEQSVIKKLLDKDS